MRSVKRDAKPPYKVLHVLNSLGVGGLEQIVLQLVKRLDPDLFRPSVSYTHPGPLLGEFQRVCPVFHTPKRFRWDGGILFRLLQLIEREGIDIVHTHFNLWGHLAGIISRRVTIYTVHLHAASLRFGEDGLHHLITRILISRTDAFTCVSKAIKENVLTTYRISPPGRVRVIYNGIPLPERASNRTVVEAEGRTPQLAVIGRLVPAKGHRYLFEAFVEVVRRYPEASLHVVGIGPLEAELKRLADRLGIAGHVRFHGVRRDILRFLEALDILVVPSILEPFGIVCLEAMAAGVPVVASRVDGIQEIIEDGKTGILVPPGDVPVLAKAILRLLEDPHLMAEIRCNGLKVVEERFEIGKMISEYQALYLECLKARGWM